MVAVAYAVLSALSYGSSDYFGAIASKDRDVTVVTALAQVVSLVCLTVLSLVVVTGDPLETDLLWGLVGGVAVAVALTTMYKALAIGPMSTAAAITALTGTVIPVAVGVAMGRVPGRIAMVGVVVSIPAAVLVSAGGTSRTRLDVYLPPRERSALVQQSAGRSSTRNLSLIAGVGFGVFFVALGNVSAASGLWPLVAARVSSIGGLVLAILLARLLTRRSTADGPSLSGRTDRRMWPTIGATGVLDCAANSFYLLALETGVFTWVAAIVSLYPVATVGLARLLLGERLSRWQLIGVALSACALSLVAFGR